MEMAHIEILMKEDGYIQKLNVVNNGKYLNEFAKFYTMDNTIFLNMSICVNSSSEALDIANKTRERLIANGTWAAYDSMRRP